MPVRLLPSLFSLSLALVLALQASASRADTQAISAFPAARSATAPDPQADIEPARREVARLEQSAQRKPDDLPLALLRLGTDYAAVPDMAVQAQPTWDRALQLWSDAPLVPGRFNGPAYAADLYASRNRTLARQLYLLALHKAIEADKAALGSRNTLEVTRSLVRFAKDNAADCPDAEAALATYLAGDLAVNDATIELMDLRGQLLVKMGRFDAARALFQQAIASLDSIGNTYPSWRRYLQEDLALVAYRSGHSQEGDRIIAELDGRSPILPKPASGADQVKALAGAGKLDDALALAREQLAKLQEADEAVPNPAAYPRKTRPSPVSLAVARATVADLLHGQGKLQEAEGYYLQALAEPDSGSSNFAVRHAGWQADLGQLYRALGDNDQAIANFEPACPALQANYEETHPDVIHCKAELAYVYGASGQPARAEALYRELAENARRHAPENKSLAADYTLAMAEMLAVQKKNAGAEAAFQQAVDALDPHRDNAQLRFALTRQAAFYRSLGDGKRSAAIFKRLAALSAH